MLETQLDPLALASHLLDTGDVERALGVLTGPDLPLDDPRFWGLRAITLRRLHRFAEAAGAAQRGLEIDPESVWLLDVKTTAEIAAGRYREALAANDVAMQLAPSDPVLLGHRAVVLAHLGDKEQAQWVLSELLRVDPTSVFALEVQARVGSATTDPNTERYVGELLAVDPENPFAHALRGNLALQRRDYLGARDAYAEAAALNPESPALARAARESRIYAHSALTPARALWKVGLFGNRYRLVVVAILLLLAVLNQGTLRMVFTVALCALVVYTRVARRVLRRSARRAFGDV